MRDPKDILVNGKQLSDILENHKKWLLSQGGERANLQKADLWKADLWKADLRNANLQNANLQNADLWNANLQYANLQNANLQNADLRNANLQIADLQKAYLQKADLRNANLQKADLQKAYLQNANLQNANLRDAKETSLIIARTYVAPETGAYIGWKKCNNGVIVKLQIQDNSERSNATGRKCRARYVIDLGHYDRDRNALPDNHIAITDTYNERTEYKKGKEVHCHEWDDNRWNECSGGIHHFITRAEAEAW